MLTKIKNFGERPITWGDYGKLCIISMVITIIYTIVYLIYAGLVKLPSIKKKQAKNEDLFTEES